MSVTSRSDGTVDVTTSDSDGVPRATGASSAALHRPWRAVIAVGEVVLTAAAVWLAFVFWSNGITTITTESGAGQELTSARYHGNWITGAIAMGGVAAVLLLDAVRQLLLAVRAAPRSSQP